MMNNQVKPEGKPADRVAKYVEAVQTLAAVALQREDATTRAKAAARAVEKAVKDENYAEAAQLKTARDEANAQLVQLREKHDKANKALATHFEAASVGFFQLKPPRPSTKEFTRVTVVDPLTHESDEAVYDDGCDTLRLEVGVHHFDDEAYRLKDWAKARGLLVHTQSATLTFSQ